VSWHPAQIEAEAWKITSDMFLYGTGYMKDHSHVPFHDVKSEDDYDKAFKESASEFDGLAGRYTSPATQLPDVKWTNRMKPENYDNQIPFFKEQLK